MAEPIATFAKNTTEVIKLELTDFNGHQLLGMRVWTRNTDRPTQKGITLSVKLIPTLRDALAKAEQTARERGLLDG